ncbi:hypothetical protein Anas_12113 [Armadillidium nasatum]|uniref:Uncharacterized protein n=1 Tax=Armadillidium nasatum TaxID=96803 RepID=A0A5N5TGU6_9CRUS|nr:hypothetical protein Anas_12113 [Armadillidium nasatum]
MCTRNSVKKFLINECYKASEEFPPGRLPTLKQVLERCLFFKEYRTENVQREVSEELYNLWIKYNVYPISANAIKMRLNNHLKEFSRLLNYDKKKQGPKFKLDASKFIEDSKKLFDIFQKDHKILAAAERKYLLKMTEDDHKFYEADPEIWIYGPFFTGPKNCQKGLLKETSKKLKVQRNSKKTDYLESKPSCSYQLYPETDQESTISESASEENIHQSYVEMLATSSNNGSDPDYIADGLSDQQNRRELRTLAEACDRYQISDRAGAAIASSVLVDFGLITRDKMQNVIDKNKLRRERNKLRKERQKEEKNWFGNITGIGFDGRRDATLQISELNGKYYTSTILEDHYVITGEPGDFYLDHFSPESGKGIDIAHGIYKKVCGTELENRLSLVKADGTNVNTGHRNGSIRYLEMFLGKPLQHDICLLHLNELPLRHVFMKLDGTTKGPNNFAGSIGSKLNGNVSEWRVLVPHKG